MTEEAGSINVRARNSKERSLLQFSEQACGPDEVARCTKPAVESLIDYRLRVLFQRPGGAMDAEGISEVPE